MQKTNNSQYATICQINRTCQGQQKEIRELKQMLKKKDKENEELRKRRTKYEEPPKNSGAVGQGAAAALPIFGKFMTKIYADKTLPYSQQIRFEFPPDINLCEGFGLYADGDLNAETETTIDGIFD